MKYFIAVVAVATAWTLWCSFTQYWQHGRIHTNKPRDKPGPLAKHINKILK